MFFFGIGVCKGGPSPVTDDTRALSSSLSIFILPWSRVSRASAVRRGSPPPFPRWFRTILCAAHGGSVVEDLG